MQFTLPFIKTLGLPVGNLSQCSQQCTLEVIQDSTDPIQTKLEKAYNE